MVKWRTASIILCDLNYVKAKRKVLFDGYKTTSMAQNVGNKSQKLSKYEHKEDKNVVMNVQPYKKS